MGHISLCIKNCQHQRFGSNQQKQFLLESKKSSIGIEALQYPLKKLPNWKELFLNFNALIKANNFTKNGKDELTQLVIVTFHKTITVV